MPAGFERLGEGMKRLFDVCVAGSAALILVVPLSVVAILVKTTSKGPILYWSDRVGKNNIIFKMPKFRSMRIDTPAVATHLLQNPQAYLTPIGGFLRKSSLDELPQLWSILTGDMSLVGPVTLQTNITAVPEASSLWLIAIAIALYFGTRLLRVACIQSVTLLRTTGATVSSIV